MFLSALADRLGPLIENPPMGPSRAEIWPGQRLHPRRDFVILYVADETEIDIVAVFHTRRNSVSLQIGDRTRDGD